jgi:organic hydroperoxide reductase OsmC/OhrA
MSVPFPHHYQAWLVRTLPSRARVEAPPRPIIATGPSPEFDGDAMGWSPEQLLLGALGASVLQTFEAFAARNHVEILSCNARAGCAVDRDERGIHFTKLTVELDLEVTDVGRARDALELTKQCCMMSRALAAPVEIDAKIRGADERQAG